mmetsp:Transcript_25584/g.70399  ORF Transcript_25584/g.70399 Transcript_25584/m.70399 type:complete len:480 (-) Transcript_25584:8-1447(-)|eukprot:CAMPEP_0172368370 /NCGR_PEP_ID=MMETSP1060-20121228/26709_1 /TAXON_ID=37318 /ORGANISM="Pseudo-nitzschia pungens, Strain cf. cingulata" /LENGTH=479 /DNA_ID=CAMNT_0013092931 /DNA_START=105 /DNA_END=1544 /DNA_ORIENTATION=-
MNHEIEMNDLLGHSEAIVSEEHDDEDRGKYSIQDQGTMRSESERLIHSRTNMTQCRIIVILFLLIGTASVMMDRFYLSHEETADPFWEMDEEKEAVNPDDAIEGLQIGESSGDEVGNRAKESGDCIDDPDFRVGDMATKHCDWVGQHHDRVCRRNRVQKHCPVACNRCSGGDPGTGANSDEPDGSESNIDNVSTAPDESKGINDEKNEDPTTIVAGIDDKDVYCEDLSRYNEWHQVRISKDDGKKFNAVEQMNHDQQSFTQGLTYARGTLFESAGKYGQSTVRILDSETANVKKKVAMEPRLFAEGITYYKDELVQITWKSQRGFKYDIETLAQIDEFHYETTVNQGWGITWDRCKDELIVTDGSSNLHFWDPRTMKEIRRVGVNRMNGSEALKMNEIEFWRGRVLANIWYEDVILVIDPETGIVEKEYNFDSLWPKSERRGNGAGVLNGISISADPDVLYVTGKMWNRMYKVQLLPEL